MRSEPLRSLLSGNTKNGIYKGKEFMGAGIPIVKMSQQFGNRFIDAELEGFELITLDDKELENYILLENDLLFSRTSVVPEGVGMCSIVREKEQSLVFESNIIRVRLNKQLVNPEFVFRYFQSPMGRGSVLSIAGGTNIKTIKASSLKELKIPLIEREIQDRVVDVLRNYDDLLANNHRRIQLLEESARMLYQEWFVHFRYPGHEQVKISDGVPNGWERTLLPEVIDVNPRTPVEKGNVIWYVPMSSLSETAMTANTANFERRTKHTNVKFRKNDVLLARITPCLENGKTGYAYFLDDDEVACGSTEFIVLRGQRLPSEFVYCLARSYPLREIAIKSMTGSSGRQRVQNSCFDKFLVPLPPKHILDEFVQVIQNNFDQIRNLMAQNSKLSRARDMLLPKLMSGELTV